MDNVVLIFTAWLGFGACGFAAGVMSVGRVRRRLQRLGVADPVPELEPAAGVEQGDLAHAA